MKLISCVDCNANKNHITVYLVLFCAMVFTYYNCLGHDFVYWDDVGYVINNEAIKGITFEHVKTAFSKSFIGNYAPIHILSYMIDYEVWGMKAAGFIFTNLVLHFFNGILLYHICLKLGLQRLGAVLAAFIFLMHPVQVESVVWISQRKNVLSMFLFLISLHSYISFRTAKDKAVWFYAISIIAYSLALLTKIAAVVLPIALLLYDHFNIDDRPLRKRIREYVPFIVVSVVLSGVAIMTQRLSQEGGPVAYYAGSGYKTFLTMITVFPQYLLNIFWPQFLSIIYGPPVKESIDSVVVISTVLIVLLIIEGSILYKRKSPLIFWYVFFFMAFIPVLQIIPLPTIMQDRYCYFPLLGLCGFVGLLADKYLFLKSHTAAKYLLIPFVILPMALLPCLARKQAKIWKDPVTLFSETAKTGVGGRYGYYSNFVEYNLVTTCYKMAEVLLAAGKPHEALVYYRKAIEVDPLHFESLLRMAFILLNEGKYKAAYQYNVRLTENYPNRFEVFYSIGQYYWVTGNPMKAEEAYQRALALKPVFLPALKDLGEIYLKRKDYHLALKLYHMIIQSGDESAENYYTLAGLEAVTGNLESAYKFLQISIGLGFRDLVALYNNPLFTPMLGSSQFKNIVAKIR